MHRLLIAAIIFVGLTTKSAFTADDEPTQPDAKRAFGYLVEVCKLGPRVSGSAGMTKQQALIVDHFSKLGADCAFQSFDVAHPTTGNPVRMNNLIVSWNPKADKRILLGCHYDTRPLPDRDPRNPRGVFLGANDGASGVALFMEMGHFLKGKKLDYGVDMVFFDGEELVYRPTDKYFLGSEHFAEDYRDKPPKYRYVWGILVDMVADRTLQLYYEQNSLKFAPQLTRSIWASAKQAHARPFVARRRHAVNDDHIPLNEIAKIPTCDIIDFDYPYWHTTQDIPANCSGRSLATVATVLLHWLENVPARETP